MIVEVCGRNASPPRALLIAVLMRRDHRLARASGRNITADQRSLTDRQLFSFVGATPSNVAVGAAQSLHTAHMSA
jgi:hypothetical protein